ncbi:MAG: OsmC family protein [bacterium]
MYTTSLTWIKGLQFIAHANSKHGIVIDTSEKGGGFGTGNGPMEMVLEALAGCSAMDVVSILQKKRQKMTEFHIDVKGERAEEHPRVYTKIHLKYTIEGRDISEKAVRDAIELSKNKYCSVSAMLAKTAKITYDLDIRNSE